MDMEAAMKRMPPHSAEAEQAVLGAMLMNKDAIMVASEMLSGEDFYQTAYGILFDAVVELFKEGRPVDLITLQERGYRVERVCCVDMFPGTGNVETVALLSKLNVE